MTSKESGHQIQPLRFTNKAPESNTTVLRQRSKKEEREEKKKITTRLIEFIWIPFMYFTFSLKKSITKAQSIANICNLKQTNKTEVELNLLARKNIFQRQEILTCAVTQVHLAAAGLKRMVKVKHRNQFSCDCVLTSTEAKYRLGRYLVLIHFCQ